jgi:uroporphyrinogen-III synthase
MRVWVTRAEPGASRTAERLRVLGHDPLVAPLLEASPLPGASVELEGVGALAFTSANGVTAFAGLSPERALRVYAVGDATAEAARDAGFAEVRSTAGDVNALAAAIVADRAQIAGAVLHPAPRSPAGDLAGALRAAGLQARAAPLYETRAADRLPSAIADVLPRMQAVLVHSPRAGQALARLSREPPLSQHAPALSVFGLSPASLRDVGSVFGRVAASAAPEEAALLALLDRSR